MRSGSVNTYDPQLKFSGKERDAESGLDYFGARYYDRSQYRFISVDPITALMPTRLISQANLYSYCGNNPIAFFDPDGKAYLTFSYGSSRMWLYMDNGICVAEFRAANNVVPGKASFGGPGKYKILGFRTEGSSGELDWGTPESTYGSYGMLVVLNNDSKVIHSGKKGVKDGWGREGYQHATNGCIRAEDEAMGALFIWDLFDKITYLYVYKELVVALPAPNVPPFPLTPPGISI